MFVVIIGGGRLGATLATLLLDQSHSVRMVEHRPEILRMLHHELPTEVIFEGRSTDPELLQRVGLEEADVVALCSSNDADNLALAYLARVKYNVPRVIARINNPRDAWLFDEKFHVDVALNQAAVMAGLIVEEMSLGDMMTLLKLRRGQFLLVEEIIPAGAAAIGKAIKDLALPDECVIAGIIRRGKVIVPRGGVRFEEGDEVLAMTDRAGAEKLAGVLGAPVPAVPPH